MKIKIPESVKIWALPVSIIIFIAIFLKPIANFFLSYFAESYYDVCQVKTSSSSLSFDDSLRKVIVLNPNISAAIADTYAGTLGVIIAILAAFLTFLAFWIQYLANRQQVNYLKQQRFEDTFFRLLEHYKKILDAIDTRDAKDATKIIATGSECFKRMYNNFKDKVVHGNNSANVNYCYDNMQNHYKHDLYHYFTFLYHILKFIKNAEISDSEKYKYASILRSTLSAYELVLIFYNCLHENGNTNFKPLVEEFSLFKNIDDSLIINKEQKSEFHEIAYSGSKKRIELLTQWRKKPSQNNIF